MFLVLVLDIGGALLGILIVLQCGSAGEFNLKPSTFQNLMLFVVTILGELQYTALMLVDTIIGDKHRGFQLGEEAFNCWELRSNKGIVFCCCPCVVPVSSFLGHRYSCPENA